MQRWLILLALGTVLFMAGCVQQKTGGDAPLTSQALASLLKAKTMGLMLIDVRTPDEYAAGHIPGAVNIPVDVITDQPPLADRAARIVVYCRSGNRSRTARAALIRLGFTNVEDFGAVGNWQGKLIEGLDPGVYSEQ
jgi:phage shock protein E